METEISKALIDFYHKILQPELAGIKDKLHEHDEKFIEMLGHFDGVHKRLDSLEAEYHSINGGLGRLEKRHDSLEKKVDGLGMKFDGLEKKVDGVERKLDGVASDLAAHRRDTEAHRKGWRVREEENGE